MQKKLKVLSIFLISTLFTGCGEVTTSNTETVQIKRTAPQNNSYDEDEATQERLLNNQNNLSKINSIVNVVNSLDSQKENTTKFSNLMNFVEDITTEVSELTDKDLRDVISQSKRLKLIPATDNIFSTVRFLNLDNDQKISVANSTIIVKGNCDMGSIKNTTLICTGNANMELAINSIVISKGKIKIDYSGDKRSTSKRSSILYSPNKIEVSHALNTVFLFSNNIKTLDVSNSDCINTTKFNSLHGNCNELHTF